MDNKEIAGKLKERIQYEDNLVNQRTNIFLVLNGLGAVAVGIGSTADGKYLITLLGVILNGLWIILSFQCLVIIFRLTKTLIDLGIDDDIPERIVQMTLGRSLVFRPDAILNIYIPLIITGAWVVGLWHLR